MKLRIEKIKETYAQQVEKKLSHENVYVVMDSVWDILASADPSPNKKNVRWLVETYLNHGFLWEDIASGETSKVYETLTEFDKHKRNLEPSERSLMKYPTLGSLWSSIKPYVGQLTSREEKMEERNKAYSEAEVVVDRDDGFKIVVPLTEYASKWFGRGTRWCTASDYHNKFEYYALKAPLFIIMMPNGDKLQLWKDGNSVQFVDENDVSVTKEYVDKNWDILKNIILHIKSFKWVSDKILTYDICFDFVKNNAKMKHVPEKYKDYAMYLEAVQHDIDILNTVPDQYKDYNLCLVAVKYDGWNLKAVPDEHKDYDMCLEAVKQGGRALRWVPAQYKDYNMCISSLHSRGHDTGSALQYTPDGWKDYDFCMKAVKQSGWAFVYVPDELRDYNMCLEAVKSHGRTLQYVDYSLIDENMCMEAIRECGYSLMHIPEKLMTYDMCLKAVQNNGTALYNVPSKFKDYDLCFEAVKQDAWALEFVAEQYKDNEMCLEAVRHKGVIMTHIPEYRRTPEIMELSQKTGERRIPIEVYQETISEVRKVILNQEDI